MSIFYDPFGAVVSVPSPHCGRVDDHDGHYWTGRHGEHFCPGPPVGTAPYKKPER